MPPASRCTKNWDFVRSGPSCRWAGNRSAGWTWATGRASCRGSEHMSWETWIAFCLLEAALCVSPGPAVVFVVSVALGRGGRSGLAGAFGILLGNAFYFVLSAMGVAAIILASNTLFTALKWAGAAYLVWLGIAMMRAAPAPVTAVQPSTLAGP